jgi:hypothetical protein
VVYLSLAVSGVRVARPKEPSSGEIILFSSYHYLSILIHYEVLFCKYESQSGFGFIGGNTTRAHGTGLGRAISRKFFAARPVRAVS